MFDPPVPGESDLINQSILHAQFRKESRYKSPLAAVGYLQPWESGKKPELVWLTNLSQHGLAFLSKNSVRPGRSLSIHLPALGEDSTNLVIEVMHSTQQLNGDWLIGCRLAIALNQEDLEKCLTADNELLARFIKR